MMTLPQHPDTLTDIAPDCRRVLREAYSIIQVRRAKRDRSGLDSAIDYYRYLASEWGIDTSEGERENPARSLWLTEATS